MCIGECFQADILRADTVGPGQSRAMLTTESARGHWWITEGKGVGALVSCSFLSFL